MMNNNNRRDVQEDNGNIVDEPIFDNYMPNEHTVQAPPESLVEPYLRRSITEHHPFQRYSPYEYVMIIDGENLNTTNRPSIMNKRESG